MKNFLRTVLPILMIILISLKLISQTAKDTLPEKFKFTKGIELPATSVKDQSNSGTCWSFATTSFIESELLRITKDTFDLSEMYFVRKAYEAKAMRYVRLHGTSNFGEGGQAHDVLNVIRNEGMLTQNDYSGLANGQTKPDHTELGALLKGMVDVIAKNPAGKLSPEWYKAITCVLDTYLGSIPSSLDEKKISPILFSQKINPDDYVEFTSYTHHPYNTWFSLEVPDNWSGGLYYNVTPDELIQIMDYSLGKGYTIAWDGDVSDKGFSNKKGVAIVPEVKIDRMPGTDRIRWEKMTEKERSQEFYTFDKPVPEKIISTEMRQAAFDNYSTTDDHLMHITGTMTDQNGKRYFHTKNSWSAQSNSYGGYVDLSEAYARLNTIAILVHKDGIPKEIRQKMGK